MIRLTLLCVCCLLLGISPGSLYGQAAKDGASNLRQSIEEKLFPLMVQEQELLNTRGPDHPEVRAIRKKIELTRSFLLTRQDGQPEEKRERPQTEADRAGRDDQAQRQEIDRRVAEVNRRIAELRAANKLDEAAEVEREARALILKLQGEPVRNKLDVLRREIEELRKTGRNEEAAKLELQLRNAPEGERRARQSAEEREYQAREAEGRREQAVRRGYRPEEAGPADLERRLNHLREAAENLVAAGLPEQAEQLRRQAETMRARFGEQSGHRPELQELHNQIRQQNERIERLEKMVQKLMEHLSTKSSAPADASTDVKNDNRDLAYAQAVIKKYDANGDGTLTKDEWSKMSRDPSAADKDNDGKIIAAEYAVWSKSK